MPKTIVLSLACTVWLHVLSCGYTKREGKQMTNKDLNWLKKADHWGEWIRYSDSELAEPESLWMMQGGNGKVRFYAKGEGQVGEQHDSIFAAACWAWANRWLWTDPDGSLDILFQLECRRWVQQGGVLVDA